MNISESFVASSWHCIGTVLRLVTGNLASESFTVTAHPTVTDFESARNLGNKEPECITLYGIKIRQKHLPCRGRRHCQCGPASVSR
jgi:hypothetical protein